MSARPHTVSPYRYALDQAHEREIARLSRPSHAGLLSLTLKQNAKGEWLVESLAFDQREGETDEDFYSRCMDGQTIVQELVALYTPAANGGES